jgi:very-short-patch-repair endonuclease
MTYADGLSRAVPGTDARLRALASRQLGVFSIRQAANLGISRQAVQRRLKSGELERVHQGVYRLAAYPESFEQRLIAASLWVGGVASHRSGASLWGLPGFGKEIIELSTSITGRSSTDQVVIHRTQQLERIDLQKIRGVPTTTCSRVLIDLGTVVERNVVEVALEEALYRRLTSLPLLKTRLEALSHKGVRGTRVLREILSERGDVRALESLLEIRLWKLICSSDLPRPERQVSVWAANECIGRVDFAYTQIKLAIEADAYGTHEAKEEDWVRNLKKHNALTLIGWRIIKVRSEDIRDRPQETIERIRQALRFFGT